MRESIVNLLWVGLGGAVGSAGRYAVALFVQRTSGSLFPWGTMTVNVLGCLIIGFLSVRFEAVMIAPRYRLALLVGALGGFTTFSTFSLETMQLFEARQALRAGVNVVATVILCLACCWLGQRIGRAMAG